MLDLIPLLISISTPLGPLPPYTEYVERRECAAKVIRIEADSAFRVENDRAMRGWTVAATCGRDPHPMRPMPPEEGTRR